MFQSQSHSHSLTDLEIALINLSLSHQPRGLNLPHFVLQSCAPPRPPPQGARKDVMKNVLGRRAGVVSCPPVLVCRTLILVIHSHIFSLIIDLRSLTCILTFFFFSFLFEDFHGHFPSLLSLFRPELVLCVFFMISFVAILTLL